MNNRELEERIKTINGIHKRYEDMTVAIPVEESWVGQKASVKVNAINKGIDWDDNTLFISPEEPLQLADRHKLYQQDIDSNKEFEELMASHNRFASENIQISRSRKIDELKKLVAKTDFTKLTTTQIKDMKRILEFEPNEEED